MESGQVLFPMVMVARASVGGIMIIMLLLLLMLLLRIWVAGSTEGMLQRRLLEGKMSNMCNNSSMERKLEIYNCIFHKLTGLNLGLVRTTASPTLLCCTWAGIGCIIELFLFLFPSGGAGGGGC